MSDGGAPLRHPRLASFGVDHGFGVRGVPEPPGVVRPKQVHGNRVAVASFDGRAHGAEADVIATDVAGLTVGIATADCVPILLAAQGGRGVAAVHAGWRGLACGVVEAGVFALRDLAGADAQLVAVLGPHVGPCCYEVDAPVLRALGARFGSAVDAAKQPARSGHAMVDLGALAREALLRAGVDAGSVARLADCCTCCDARRFHSYRRDGPRAGRLVHYIAVRGGRTGAGAGGRGGP